MKLKKRVGNCFQGEVLHHPTAVAVGGNRCLKISNIEMGCKCFFRDPPLIGRIPPLLY